MFPRISCPEPVASDIPALGVDWGKCTDPKNGRGDKIHYHKLGYLFVWYGG